MRSLFLSLAFSTFVPAPSSDAALVERSQETREESVAAIKKLGGDVEREEGELEVWLRGPNVTDAALNHLAALKDLSRLNLSKSRITDVGLAKLADFRRLKRVNLSATPIRGCPV